MNLQREIEYKEYVERENEFYRAPYNPELNFYTIIQSGDIEHTKELCKERLLDKKGLGTLSKNPLQNFKYHFTITTALVARYCIEGGMELAQAYSLSDYYIQKADRCKSIEEISDLHPVMALDYAARMKKLRKNRIFSRHISQCLDYIYEHLHTKITVDTLAKHVALNPNYLSKLFKKETGQSISIYIQRKKIETSQNMLAHSDYSISEISSTLAFSTQSYFTEIFKKYVGITPLEYRSNYYNSISIMSHNVSS